MEGQPDAEPRAGEKMHCEREPVEDECKHWPGGQVGNTLHLVSAVAQWILLLACLIYLGIDFLRLSAVRTHPFVIMRSSLLPSIPGKSIKGVAVNLTAELGPIQIRNGSIVIPCDGLYLVSLKSSIYLEEEDWLKLTLQGTHKASSSALWE
ncbi:TNFL4 factor, partial [Acrocephalus arundinaceus]|nr:TNFL4 factor [Acrocephalus arundinaceus]